MPPAKIAQLDEQLDTIHQFIHNECPKQRKALIQQLLNRQKQLLNEGSTIADVALLSAFIGEQKRNTSFFSKDDKKFADNIRNMCVTHNPFVGSSILRC